MSKVAAFLKLEIEIDGKWNELTYINDEDINIKFYYRRINDFEFNVDNKTAKYLKDVGMRPIKLSTIEVDENEDKILFTHIIILESWVIKRNTVISLSPHRTVKIIREPNKDR